MNSSSAPKIQSSANGEVNIIVDMIVALNQEAEFAAVFHAATTSSRLEPGNVIYKVQSVIGSPRHYILYEQWRNKETLESHFEQPYTKALFAMLGRCLEQPFSDGLRFLEDTQLTPQAASAMAVAAS